MTRIPFMSIRIVHDDKSLDQCLQALTTIGVKTLSVDLEGDLSRHGNISTIQIMSDFSPTVWIIDIITLGPFAFTYSGSTGQSLKQVLESKMTTKVCLTNTLFFWVLNLFYKNL